MNMHVYSGRRRAQYRQSPRSCSSRHGSEDDNSVSPSSASSVATKKSKLPSPRSLHIGKQQAATTFAAAVTPSSSSKKPSLMSSPLLGGEVMTKSTMRSSFGGFSSVASSRKRLPSFGAPSSAHVHGKPSSSKRRSISKSIKSVTTRFAKVNCKVRRGKKAALPKQNQGLSTTYRRFDSSPGSSQACGSSFQDAFDNSYEGVIMEPDYLQIDTSLPLLSFDEAEVTNHFRTTEIDDFSLHKALSRSSSPLDNSQEEAFAFESPVEDVEHENSMPRSTSCSSIPSLSESLEVCELNSDIALPQVAISNDDAADSALAWGCFTFLMGSPAPKSVLMEEKKQKKRAPVNLWQGDDDTAEDLDDIISLPCDESEQESQALSQEDENRIKFNEALELAMSRREDGKQSTPRGFYKSYKSTVAELSPKSKQLEAVEDVKHEDVMPRSTSCNSMPSLCEESAELCDVRCKDEDIMIPQDATNKEDAADSALAWGCLVALLGSPAPTSVLLSEKKQKKRTPVNLWQDEAMGEDLDDAMPSLPQDDDDLVGQMQALSLDDNADDECSIPSVSWTVLMVGELQAPSLDANSDDDCSIPSVSSEAQDESFDLAFCTTPTAAKSNADIADSTLAWTVFTAILGSPAPSSVVSKSASKKRVNLWENDEESDLLPEIDEQDDNEDESDVLSLPSIDLNELVDADEAEEDLVVTELAGSKEESADSILAWSALGMFLGAPAPKSVSRKNRKMRVNAARNLWDDGEPDTIPSIYPEDNDITCILSPGGPSTAQKWFVEQDKSDDDDDAHSIPSLSRTTSLSETTDDEDEYPSSPLNQSMMSLDDLIDSPKRESNSKGIADSVLAWSALAAFMGSPAPKALSPKKKKEAKFLWGEECDVLPADLPFQDV